MEPFTDMSTLIEADANLPLTPVAPPRHPKPGGLGVCLAIACALLLAPERAAAQTAPPSALTGVVYDPSGAVVPGATVILRAETSAFERIVDTGRDGTFVVSGLEPALYSVSVVAPGFSMASSDVSFPATAKYEVTLAPAPVLEQVRVVSGSLQEELRQRLNTRVDVLSRTVIEDTGAQSVAEVLREVPGVVTRRGSEGSTPGGEQIQGIDSRQVLVLLDGQPVVGARGIKRGGVINLDRQSVDRLERIEVVKGAASALYGSDAIGGVINLITRDATAPLDVAASVSGGNRGDLNGRAEFGVRRRAWSGLFSTERHQGDGFDLTPTTFDTTAAAFRRNEAFAKVKGRVSDSLNVSAVGTRYSNRSRGHSNGELGPQEDDVRDRAFSANTAIDWLARPSTTVQGRIYVANYDETAVGRLAPPRLTRLEPGLLREDIAKVDVSISHFIGGRQHLQAGGEWWSDRYEGTNRIAFDEVHATTGVVWAQHRLSLGDRLTTTVGGRIDHHSVFGTAVSPKFALNTRVTDTLHARVSYGRGFRAPDLGQLYYRFLNPTNFYQVLGNPNLDPEHAQSLQFGGEYLSRGRRTRLGVNLFYNDIDDLIESVNLGMVSTEAQLAALLEREGLDPSFRPVLGRMVFAYKNVNDAITRGVEADGDFAVRPDLTVGGAYTFLDAYDAGTSVELTGRHRHHGHVRAAWLQKSWGLRANLRGTFFGSWIASRSTANNLVTDTRAPRFALWDAFVSQRIARGLSGFAAVDNLTNSRDPNTGVLINGAPAPLYRPEAGRTLRVGLRWSWAAQ